MDRNRARAPAGPRIPRSRRIPVGPASSEQPADGTGKLVPDRTPRGELTFAAPGDRIDAPPSPGIGGHPTTAKQARLLEAMQHGVDRAFGELERAGAPALDFLDDGVA